MEQDVSPELAWAPSFCLLPLSHLPLASGLRL